MGKVVRGTGPEAVKLAKAILRVARYPRDIRSPVVAAAQRGGL